jgi:SAM-dependent methyltransferase
MTRDASGHTGPPGSERAGEPRHPGADFYDRYWATSDEAQSLGPMSRHRRRLVVEELSRLRFGSLLDVSCGQGFLLADVARAFPGVRLTGTELSLSGLEHARRRVESRFHRLDITRERLDERFDCVTLTEVLEHVEDEAAALANLAAMTEGNLVLTVPGGKLSPSHIAAGDLRTYDRPRLEALLAGAGFELIRFRRFGFPMYDPVYLAILNRVVASGRSVGPAAASEGLGPWKRAALGLMYGALFLNVPNRGAQIVAVARRRRGE